MMDKERRNNLRRVINQCRKILEEDVERGLAYYGILADGTFLELDKLEHLNDEEIEIRKRIELAIKKELVGGLDKKEAVHRYIRHTVFTFLNRIAALRAMEVRGLIKETIIQRSEYGGRSLREREIAEADPSLSPYEILKSVLIQAFKEVSEEIKILFDVNSEYSIVFPSEKACRDVIKLLTENITENDWKEDDIIGWIYQYFNDEARKEYRKAKRKPKPDDIPVINQFYTPYWIVKVLVDNTLGRLWLEMHPESKLGEFCTYLVPLKNGQNKREVKRVREIKVLDPACGSGHFLVYAFDVLYRMYQEDEPNTPASEIPSLILENNLFGIDIDLFSTQLAALSLYLKAKRDNRNLKIRKMNIVCADVRISDGKKRIEFLQRFRDDPDLQEIFAKLFDDLSYTYEIGSLLKIREPFEKLFRERRKGPKQTRLVLHRQTQLGKEGIVDQARFLVEPPKGSANSVLIIPKERTIEEMIEELRKFEREAIEAHDMGNLLFATEAEKSVGLLALLSEKYDVVLMNPPYGDMPLRTKEYLKRHYPKTHHDYYAAFIEQSIELAKNGGYIGALCSRTFMFLEKYHWVREVLFNKKARLQLILDLGFGVLDVAIARWAAFTAQKISWNEPQQNTVFVRLTPFPDESKKRFIWEKVIDEIKRGKIHPLVYEKSLKELSKIPGTPFSYWVSKTIITLFNKYPPLDRDVAKQKNKPKLADVKQGLATADDLRFTRYWWEVDTETIASCREETLKGKKWVPFENDVYLFYFFNPLRVLVNWENDGKEIKSYIIQRYPYLNGKWEWVVKNTDFYFNKGLAWSTGVQRSQLKKVYESQRMPFRILPSSSIFGVAAQAVIPKEADIYWLLAILTSKLIFYMSRLFMLDRMPGTGVMASLPICTPNGESKKHLTLLAREAYDLLRELSAGDEISTQFIKPWILHVLHGFNSNEKPITQHPLVQQFKWSDWPSVQKIRSVKGSLDSSLKELAELCVKRQLILNKRIKEIQKEIDDEVYRIYGISEEDRALIERELALQQTSEEEEIEEKAEEVEEEKDVISAEEHVKRLISYYVKKVMKCDEDGIIPLDEMFRDNLLNKIREQIAQDFGKNKVDKIELEISEILGKSLKRWIEEDYFDFHVTLYRRRPIFWQLTSSNLGKSKLPGVFSCFLYYHKLDRDTIPKILAFYLNPIKERLYRERERIFNELEKARASGDRKRINELSKAYEESLNKINEIENMEKALNILHNPRKDKTKLKPDAKWIEKAIAEVRDNGWNPIIDYGVKVNIEPLKELKILHPAADRVK